MLKKKERRKRVKKMKRRRRETGWKSFGIKLGSKEWRIRAADIWRILETYSAVSKLLASYSIYLYVCIYVKAMWSFEVKRKRNESEILCRIIEMRQELRYEDNEEGKGGVRGREHKHVNSDYPRGSVRHRNGNSNRHWSMGNGNAGRPIVSA